jgi:hypothetical protein
VPAMVIDSETGYDGVNARSDVNKSVALNLYLNILIDVMGRID